MSALIQVSNLNYNTNNGTISSVNIKIGSQLFSITFEGNKYSVINKGDTLGKDNANPIASDKNPAVEPKTVTPVVEPKTVTPVVEPKTVTPVVEPKATTDHKSFKNNDELILKLIDNGFTRLNTPDTGTSGLIPPMLSYEERHRVPEGPDRSTESSGRGSYWNQ